MSNVVKFVRNHPKAIVPTKGSKLAAGHDLYSISDVIVDATGRALIDTGIKISLPCETYGRIAPRSGLALKHFIDVGAGVIDQDYRGSIKVLLFNHGSQPFKVKEGDRIAQLIIEKIVQAEMIEVSQLENTSRGDCGFGSSGQK